MTVRRSIGAVMLAERLRSLLGTAAAATAPGPPVHSPRAGTVAGGDTAPPLPDYVAHALARWHLLHDVPFRYVVPDARLLPSESIRFFTLDEAWLDALATGALAMGGGGTREQAQARRAVPEARVATRRHRRLVRDVARGRMTLGALSAAAEDGAPPEVVSGFLLRSALVSGWPGLQVCAWASDDPALVPPQVNPVALATNHPELVVPILRLERLSPAVLLALFEGVPRLVWIEEPHHSVQYGLEATGTGFTVVVRDETGGDTGQTLAVPMRPETPPGVVDVTALAGELDQARRLPKPRGAAALALELLQAPSRQRFATSAAAAPSPVRRGPQ